MVELQAQLRATQAQVCNRVQSVDGCSGWCHTLAVWSIPRSATSTPPGVLIALLGRLTQVTLALLLLQVVEVSSWLTSNARLLMEVGAKQAAGKNSSIRAHHGAEAAHKPAGFHSDQVGCRRA